MVRGRWEPQKGRYWASKTNVTFFIVWLTASPALKRRLFLQFHGKSMRDCGWSDGYTFFGMLSSEKWGWFFSLLDLRLAQDVFSRKVQQKRCYAYLGLKQGIASLGALWASTMLSWALSCHRYSMAAPCGNAMRTYGKGRGSSWALDFQLTLLKTQVKPSWTLKLNRKKVTLIGICGTEELASLALPEFLIHKNFWERIKWLHC